LYFREGYLAKIFDGSILIASSAITVYVAGDRKKERRPRKERKIAGVAGQTVDANVVGKFSATDTIRRLNEKRPLLRLHRECLYAIPRRAFSFSPRSNLPLSPRLLSFSLRLVALDVAICAISRSLAAGSANESARRRAFTAFLRHGGGCGRLGLLPPQRSYCFSHPNPPSPPRQPPRARNHLSRFTPSIAPSVVPLHPEFTSSSSPPPLPRARYRAPDRLLRHCA